MQAAQAEVREAFAAIERRLALSANVTVEGLESVRGEFTAAALPDLAQQLRALNAKVAALEGSTLSAGEGLQSLFRTFAAVPGLQCRGPYCILGQSIGIVHPGVLHSHRTACRSFCRSFSGVLLELKS